jgi:hypothetical protein
VCSSATGWEEVGKWRRGEERKKGEAGEAGGGASPHRVLIFRVVGFHFFLLRYRPLEGCPFLKKKSTYT